MREDILITIDSQAGVVTVEDSGRTRTLRMDEPEAFRVVSEAWLLAEGLPYQTLIASLLHKYAAGRLKEI